MNSRPLNDAKTQEALNRILDIFAYYDLAGAVAVVNPQEWGYGYSWETTWNAMVHDPDLPAQEGLVPIGFRIRARESELGPARAKELIEGAAFTIAALKDFGTQTKLWTEDLIRLLRKAGFTIDYRPFDGKPLPRIHGRDLRQR